MKATGIVRRIDDLGRVVIPKEIRRTMRIREGDPLEIYTSRDGEVIFKKYSLMGGLDDFAMQFCETLSKSTGAVVAVTDRDSIIAVAGGGKRELLGKSISPELERIMDRFLHTLSPRDCNVFLRRYWYGETLEEAARRYEMKLNTVKTSLYRSREKLRKYLEKEGVAL